VSCEVSSNNVGESCGGSVMPWASGVGQVLKLKVAVLKALVDCECCRAARVVLSTPVMERPSSGDEPGKVG